MVRRSRVISALHNSCATFHFSLCPLFALFEIKLLYVCVFDHFVGLMHKCLSNFSVISLDHSLSRLEFFFLIELVATLYRE